MGEKDTIKDTINSLPDNERTVFEEMRMHPKVTANDLSEILNINLRNTKKIIEKLKEKVYETTTRPRKVLEARIELWNRSTGEITFPKAKSKYNRWTRRHIPGAPKTMKLTGNTSGMLRHYMGNRKKEHIFINERAGKSLTQWHFDKMIDK